MHISVQNGDILRVRAATQLSSTTLYVTICMLDKNGRYTSWHEAIPISSAYTLVTKDIVLPAGVLEKVACSTTDANCLTADLYASVTLHHQDPDTDPVGIPLLSGYVTRLKPVIYPGSPPQGPLEGPPSRYSLYISSPGQTYQYTVGPSRAQRVRMILAQVTTDATSGDRFVELRYYSAYGSGGHVGIVASPYNHPASITHFYGFGIGHGSNSNAFGVGVISLPLLDVILYPNDRIDINILNVQAGDSIDVVNFSVDTWLYI